MLADYILFVLLILGICIIREQFYSNIPPSKEEEKAEPEEQKIEPEPVKTGLTRTSRSYGKYFWDLDDDSDSEYEDEDEDEDYDFNYNPLEQMEKGLVDGFHFNCDFDNNDPNYEMGRFTGEMMALESLSDW